MPDSIAIKNIISGAKTVKEYFGKYNKYPTSVTAGGITFTLPQFVYLMSQAIYKIGNSNYKDVVINKDEIVIGDPNGKRVQITPNGVYKFNESNILDGKL